MYDFVFCALKNHAKLKMVVLNMCVHTIASRRVSKSPFSVLPAISGVASFVSVGPKTSTTPIFTANDCNNKINNIDKTKQINW